MPETYQPGRRRQNTNTQMSENRYAWLNTGPVNVVLLVGDEGAEAGHDVVVFIPRPGRIPDLTVNLTAMTGEELDAFQDFINTAISWAKPVVDRRDKEAKDAWDAGDDSFSRSYRPVPQLVYRKRPGREHGEGVRERPEGVPESSGGGGSDNAGRVRGTGDELVEPDSQPHESENNGAETDQPEGIRKVGLRPPKPLGGLHRTDSGEDDSSSDPGGDQGSHGNDDGGEES